MKLSVATSLVFLLGLAAAFPADITDSGDDNESLDIIEATGAINVRLS